MVFLHLLVLHFYMAEHLDDKELLMQFKNESSKEAAYTRIIKKYQEKLYWHIRRMVVEHEDANDVLQNMFIKVWKNLDNFREDSQLYTWLYRIATNESLSFLEQQKLPDKQKAVFNLRYFEEMPYQEMSRVLETSEGALKASYHHAVKKIEDYILNR